MTIVPIFPTPVSISNINIDTTDFMETIKSFEYKRFMTQSASYTVDKRILHRPELKKLYQQFEQIYNNYIYNELGFSREIEFKVTTSWVVKLEPGDYSDPHYHAQSMFSCVFYLDVDEKSGGITFQRRMKLNELGDSADPLIIVPLASSGNFNPFNAPSWKYNPSKNDFIIFPSHLTHDVSVNTSNITRYSLAFNLFPSGTFGIDALELRMNIN
jgi:uncharacterized protein (TIGR02466 family)